MGITGSIIVYVLIWWIIFFSVLPVGIQSNKEKFKERIEGIDPGAPNNPKIAILGLLGAPGSIPSILSLNFSLFD